MQTASSLYTLLQVRLERTVAMFGLDALIAVNPPAIKVTGEALLDDAIGTHVPKL